MTRHGLTNEQQIGLCGWNGSQQSYIDQFSCIELQTTFYYPPSVRVAQRWRSIAPDDFTYCMKAWQLITHQPVSPTYRRLRTPVPDADKPFLGGFQPTDQVFRAWERTRDIADAVRAHVVLFQCPQSFFPTKEHLANLTTFFRTIDRGPYQLAWEPRGDAWHEDLVRELCQELTLLHCVDPLVNQSWHGTLRYWRLHGIGSYSYEYTDHDLAALRDQLLATEQPTYVMFNNYTSKKDALRFSHLLSARRPAKTA